MRRLVPGVAIAILLAACGKHAPPPAASVPAPPSPAPAATPPQTPPPRVRQTPPPAPGPPQVNAPQLGEVLNPAQRAQYRAEVDLSLAHAKGDIEKLAGRNLNSEQQGVVQQVRDFITEAERSREKDLVAAKGLAQKAEVLARNLLANIH